MKTNRDKIIECSLHTWKTPEEIAEETGIKRSNVILSISSMQRAYPDILRIKKGNKNRILSVLSTREIQVGAKRQLDLRSKVISFCLSRWVTVEQLAEHLKRDRAKTAQIVTDINRRCNCFDLRKDGDNANSKLLEVKALFTPGGKESPTKIGAKTTQSGDTVKLARERKAQGICAAPECFPMRRVA